jgi:adenylyltransferase/sulfurtransferase
MGGSCRGSVVVIGVGGLGAAAALELAAARVGRIGLVDADRVEISNLHRQILHGPDDIGRPKAEVAAEKLRRAWPSLDLEVHVERLTADNAAALLTGYDVVIDATDDAPSKFLLNDACVSANRILIHAGVTGLSGQLFTIVPRRGACLRCLFPEVPNEGEIPSCRDAGILGPLAGLIGVLQAREALSALAGAPTTDRLLTVDARSLNVREVLLRRSPLCPVCGPYHPLAAGHPAHAANEPSKELS